MPGQQQTSSANSANMSQAATRPQISQDDNAVANNNRNQGSNSKNNKVGNGGGNNNRFQQMRQFKGGQNYNNRTGAAANSENQQVMVPPVKLPRTGIEQVFCGDRPRFIEAHREFERIASVNVSQISLFLDLPLFQRDNIISCLSAVKLSFSIIDSDLITSISGQKCFHSFFLYQT